MDALTHTLLLRFLAALATTLLSLLTGAALSMYYLSIPIIASTAPPASGHPPSPAAMLHQFHLLITLGARYLQTGARALAGLLAALVALLYAHPEPETQARWVWFAAALGVLVQVAWYEAVFVFPTNDRLVAMKGEVRKGEGDERMRAEILRLLGKWQSGHVGRIVIPLVAAGLALRGVMF